MDEDPIPLFALKLLGGAMEANAALAADVAGAGLAPQLFSFLSLEHPHNNVHNVRACAVLAASPALRDGALGELSAAPKAAAVLLYAFDNSVEPFLEPALAIAAALLRRRREAGARSGGGAGALHAEPLLDVRSSLSLSSLLLPPLAWPAGRPASPGSAAGHSWPPSPLRASTGFADFPQRLRPAHSALPAVPIGSCQCALHAPLSQLDALPPQAAPVLVELLSASEPVLAEQAALCLSLLLECFPEPASAGAANQY